MVKPTGKARGWMLTLQQSMEHPEQIVEPETLHNYLSELADKFIFQKEKGNDTGNIHYQIYIYFKNPRYGKGIKDYFKNLVLFPHIEKAVSRFDYCWTYCSKPDTRIDGPWENGVFKKVITNELARIDIFRRELIDKITAEGLGITVEKLHELRNSQLKKI